MVAAGIYLNIYAKNNSISSFLVMFQKLNFKLQSIFYSKDKETVGILNV